MGIRGLILGVLAAAVAGALVGALVSGGSLGPAQLSAAPQTAPADSTEAGAWAARSELSTPSTMGEAAVAGRQPLPVPELVRYARPSVVHIATEAITINSLGRSVPGGGVATGFIIDRQGLILTNNHVVAGARRIVVTLWDERTFEAAVVGRDPQTDLAVIRIDAGAVQPVRLGSSDELEVGESVVAIGHALDLPGGPTVTTGVVSALDRTITGVGARRQTLSGLIQTDASINPGNSGGPLLNRYGAVVGVNTVGAGGSQGIGFAIAIDGARPVIEALIQEGRVLRGFLGVSIATITRGIARQADLPVTEGVYLVRVWPGSPAAASGLRAGDMLVAINQDRVPDAGALNRLLAKYRAGTTVEVEFVRPSRGGAQRLRAQVTLGEPPDL